MGTCPVRNVRVQLQVNLEPEAEPIQQPATEQVGASYTEADTQPATKQVGASNDEADSTASWEQIRPARPARQAPRVPFVPARHLWQPQNICPSEAELLDARNRVYIVWKVPGQDWAGIHYGAGQLPWSQLRSWACAADNMLYPAAASKQLRWCRASNCIHEQLATAFQREAGGQELRYWKWLT